MYFPIIPPGTVYGFYLHYTTWYCFKGASTIDDIVLLYSISPLDYLNVLMRLPTRQLDTVLKVFSIRLPGTAYRFSHKTTWYSFIGVSLLDYLVLIYRCLCIRIPGTDL